MLIIPIQPVPAQFVTAPLAGQTIQIELRQRFHGLFATIHRNNALIVAGVRCHDRARLVRSAYLGLTGDFQFIDNEGADDPHYSGLGTRFSLAFLEPGDF